MAKSRTVEQTLAELSAIKEQHLPPDALGRELKRYLENKQSLVVAKAAAIAAASSSLASAEESLEPHLIAAFGRFMEQGPASDKGCFAKKEIVNALHELGCTSPAAEDVYLAGIRYVQPEPVWGGTQDTADELRGLCGYGLVRCRHREVSNYLAELLADPSHLTRSLAARGIAYAGREEGAALLRFKILAGDEEGLVIAECLTALRQLSGLAALDFFRRLLAEESRHALHESVSLTLGEMRHADALAVLRARWDADPLSRNRIRLLLPMALSRLPQAIDFLIDLVRQGPDSMSTAALDALRMYREYAAIREKIAAAVAGRDSRVVAEHYAARFDEG